MPSSETITNGTLSGNEDGKFIDSINPDDPEYQREMMRPAEIKEDVKLMEHRKRVSLILNSEAFHSELEEIISSQLRQGSHPASLLALQQISDLLLPQGKNGISQAGSRGNSTPTIPINDIRGTDTQCFVKGERLLRCKLASVYRLIDFFGLTHGANNHITARISKEHEHFLINPFGLLYSEITAASLVKIDLQGEVVERGSTILGVNRNGWMLHSALHSARSDIRCIIHLYTPAIVAVSAMRAGLLPLSQEAMILGKIAYHNYKGFVANDSDAETLANDLGKDAKVLMLRNHGAVVCGESVEEAWHLAFNMVSAAETQICMGALVAHPDALHLPSNEAQESAHRVGSSGGGGVDHKSESGYRWRTGELEFEALMRLLDNAGHRTGYIYRQPVIKPDRRLRRYDDVEVPPSSSSFTYYYDGDMDHSKYQSVQKLLVERSKQGVRNDWLNTPNTYHKEEIEETGTKQPKKITKWVADNSEDRTPGAATRLTGANIFAPIGEDPKELKSKQKEVKSAYYADSKNAGPQSRVLDGLTPEDMHHMVEEGKAKQVGDRLYAVGSASKGIIQREHQHNAVVYHAAFAPNPFEKITDKDLEEYKKEVERKNNPEAYQEALLEAEAAREAAQREAELASKPPLKVAVHHTSPPTAAVSSTDGPIEAVVKQGQVPEKGQTVTVEIPSTNAVAAAIATAPSAAAAVNVRRISDKERSVQRSDSDVSAARQIRNEVNDELRRKSIERSKSERRQPEPAHALSPPIATDTMRSDTSGCETYDEQRGDSPTKAKKDKKKMFSFGKTDKKDKKKKVAK